jgi:hypothetical protein
VKLAAPPGNRILVGFEGNRRKVTKHLPPLRVTYVKTVKVFSADCPKAVVFNLGHVKTS